MHITPPYHVARWYFENMIEWPSSQAEIDNNEPPEGWAWKKFGDGGVFLVPLGCHNVFGKLGQDDLLRRYEASEVGEQT